MGNCVFEQTYATHFPPIISHLCIVACAATRLGTKTIRRSLVEPHLQPSADEFGVCGRGCIVIKVLSQPLALVFEPTPIHPGTSLSLQCCVPDLKNKDIHRF